MKIRIFTVAACDGDVTELNSFLAANRIARVEHQFVSDGGNSFWTFCVTCADGSAASGSTSGGRLGKKRVDYREVLSESDFAIFAKLRTLRKTLADQEGVPAYALFTNEQLAELVTRNVQSKTALGEVPGVGDGKVEKYAEAFLTALKQARSELAEAGTT